MENNGKSIMQNFIDILSNEPYKAFDFICNNCHEFSKGELTDIVKELLYGIYWQSKFGTITESDHDAILIHAAEELTDYYLDD